MFLKYDIVGNIFCNKAGYRFEVLNWEGRNDRSVSLYCIRFIDTGTVVHGVTSGHIRAGEVKDYFAPSVFGVGCLGSAQGFAKRHESRRLYYTWRNMIRRCYDENYSKYKWYGAKGVQVCDRWKRLDYFIQDIVNLPGYNAEKFESGELELDKDILSNGSKIYSPETCCLVTHTENKRDALHRRWHPNNNAASEKCNDYPQGVDSQ